MEKTLLEKYITGELCTPGELEEIKAYLDNPDHRLEHLMLQAWQQAGGPVSESRKANTLEQVLKATGQAGEARVVPLMRKKRMPFLRVAASIAALVLVTGVLVYLRLNSRNNSRAIAWKTIRNEGMGVQKITLPEGTVVWLNSRSSVSYPLAFLQQPQREIRLSGEAYFEVAGNAAHPFVVHADSLYTTVLGTAFTVKAWPGTNHIQVALLSGCVQVNGYTHLPGDILAPGDVLTWIKANGQLQKVAGGIRKDMYEWKEGKIVLSNTPLAEAVKELEQVYGVTIRYDAAQLAKVKLTGSFRRDSIDRVLHNMLFAADMTFFKKDNTYFITRQQ